MSIKNLVQFNGRIEELGRRVNLNDLPGPYVGPSLADDLARVVAERTLARVGRKVSPDGAPWKPLSARYVARKLAQGFSGEIGVRTGEMLAPEQFLAALGASSNNFMTVGYGTSEGAVRKMRFFGRLRPVLGVDPEMRSAVLETIRESLGAEFLRAGFR